MEFAFGHAHPGQPIRQRDARGGLGLDAGQGVGRIEARGIEAALLQVSEQEPAVADLEAEAEVLGSLGEGRWRWRRGRRRGE
ncbi:MAG: hypothetical protein RLZZ618_3535 [Pseudomonadota bacterium]